MPKRLPPLARLGFGPRVVLAAVPTLVGLASWEWLQDIAGSGWPFGIHPFWIYLWHPPLMDVLVGLMVLVPFIDTRKHRAIRAVGLVVLSFAVHTIAVAVVVNTQWILSPVVESRFISALPVAIIATLAMTYATRVCANLHGSANYLRFSLVAGASSGLMFVLATEADPVSWSWRLGLHWIVWHVAVCTAIHFGRSEPE